MFPLPSCVTFDLTLCVFADFFFFFVCFDVFTFQGYSLVPLGVNAMAVTKGKGLVSGQHRMKT